MNYSTRAGVSCFDGTASVVAPHLAGSRPEALSAQFSITRAAFSSRPSTVPQAQRWTCCARGFRSCRPQAEQVWDSFTVQVGTLSQASPVSSALARSMAEEQPRDRRWRDQASRLPKTAAFYSSWWSRSKVSVIAACWCQRHAGAGDQAAGPALAVPWYCSVRGAGSSRPLPSPGSGDSKLTGRTGLACGARPEFSNCRSAAGSQR